MKHKLFYKKISILFLGASITSCAAIENALESKITTNVDVAIVNQGSAGFTAYAVATQKYDANHCTHNGQSRSNSVFLSPGQSAQVSTSIECNQKVNTWVNIQKRTNYKIGSIMINHSSAAFYLRPGVQFHITDKQHQNRISIQIVNSNLPQGGYDGYWPLSPTGAPNVAWIESEKLYFSIPQYSDTEMEFIEFEDTLGFSNFGPGPIEHINGVYRGRFIKSGGPFISLHISSGSILCDDVGCNQN